MVPPAIKGGKLTLAHHPPAKLKYGTYSCYVNARALGVTATSGVLRHEILTYAATTLTVLIYFFDNVSTMILL